MKGGAMSGFSWTTILSSSFQTLWVSMIDFLPKLFGALVIFVLGVLIATGAASITRRIIKFLRIDKLVERLKIEQTFEHAGIKIVVSDIFAWIVKWFLILVFFVTAVDIMGWSEIVSFLNQVLLYLPNVAVAVAISLIGIILGGFIGETIIKVVAAGKMKNGKLLGGLAQYAIIIFSVMAALIQLNVAASLIQILFIGIVAMIAIAGGISFGLGGREEAGKLIATLAKRAGNKKKK
ncbi:MAG: hypothetical protein COU51_02320 [Parcubacteria group bacterium CG10_big_fil_rev_8_21_14_0_10_36_14]|nr:MAG: hypothetical protein COU51_02320 [Parcubacteria group bacterium CG10_big_fil_rev_8_21_14_0_10_36_14]